MVVYSSALFYIAMALSVTAAAMCGWAFASLRDTNGRGRSILGLGLALGVTSIILRLAGALLV